MAATSLRQCPQKNLAVATGPLASGVHLPFPRSVGAIGGKGGLRPLQDTLSPASKMRSALGNMGQYEVTSPPGPSRPSSQQHITKETDPEMLSQGMG